MGRPSWKWGPRVVCSIHMDLSLRQFIHTHLLLLRPCCVQFSSLVSCMQAHECPFVSISSWVLVHSIHICQNLCLCHTKSSVLLILCHIWTTCSCFQTVWSQTTRFHWKARGTTPLPIINSFFCLLYFSIVLFNT